MYVCVLHTITTHFVQVYSILRHVAEVLEYTKDEQLESLYERTAWFYDDKYKKPGYGAYDVFKQAVSWVLHLIHAVFGETMFHHYLLIWQLCWILII